jgi:hypothetical protein
MCLKQKRTSTKTQQFTELKPVRFHYYDINLLKIKGALESGNKHAGHLTKRARDAAYLNWFITVDVVYSELITPEYARALTDGYITNVRSRNIRVDRVLCSCKRIANSRLAKCK